MEKRVIIAIALSALIIITFQYFVAKPKPYQPEARTAAQTLQETVVKEANIKPAVPAEILSEENILDIETDKYIVTFSNIGGSIKSIRLKEYKNLNSKDPLELVNIADPGEYIFALTAPLMLKPLDMSIYAVEKDGNNVIYSLNGNGMEITKTYILHKSKNSIELSIKFYNISTSPIRLTDKVIGGSGMLEANKDDQRFIEVISKIDGKSFNFKNPKDSIIINHGLVGWTALKNKYFSIIIKPFFATSGQFYKAIRNGSLLTGIESQETEIAAGSILEQRFVLYVGPSKISSLKEFGFAFEESIDYGFFGFIAKIMLSVMGFVNNVVHSWGISIIILSVLLNIILFPLSMQSFRSMKKMQELQPQMEKLKAECKDNPQKLNKEMLELYKKYNINPLSGCLPLILQMPVFIALYQALMKSIDLRGAHFLWIKDLSSPDAIQIPVSLPVIGNSFNLLPLLMIIGMVVQQKISTSSGAAVSAEQKQQQKMMLIIMPIMFGFIFYNMPSGLVLYWLTSTILTVTEQYLIFKKDKD